MKENQDLFCICTVVDTPTLLYKPVLMAQALRLERIETEEALAWLASRFFTQSDPALTRSQDII